MTESINGAYAFDESNIQETLKAIEKAFVELNILKKINQFVDYLSEENCSKILDKKYLQKKEEELNLLKEKANSLIEERKNDVKNDKTKSDKSFKDYNYSKDIENEFYNDSNSIQSLMGEIKLQFKDFELLFNPNCGCSFYEKVCDLNKQVNILIDKYNGISNNILNTSEISNISGISSSTFDSEYKPIDIKSIEDFNKNIKINNNSDKVKLIKINGKNFSLFSLMNIDFINLKILNLNSNGIKDIYLLLSCNMPILEKLKLENNEINNDCIDLLKKVNLPHLIKLSLYNNKITSIKVFEILSNFELKTFYIGKNKFNENELNNYKDSIKLPDNLEELGLSENFDEKTNNFIKKIKLHNLIMLYISANAYKSLEDLKDMHFNRLQSFWAPYNKLTDMKELLSLENKEEITEINLRGNNITKIDEKVLDLFKNLKSLNLEDNEKMIYQNKDIIKKYENKIEIKI